MSLLDSSWKPWLPEGGFHFLTKDAPYVGGDWTIEQIMQTIPDTPSPPLFKKIEGAESVSLPFHEIGDGQLLPDAARPEDAAKILGSGSTARKHSEAAANDLGRPRVRRVEILRVPAAQDKSVRRRTKPDRSVFDGTQGERARCRALSL